MDKQTFILRPNHPSRRLALAAVRDAPDEYTVIIREQTRSDEQNAIQHPIIRAISRQAEWMVDGEPTKLGEEDTRHFLAACFRKENNRMVQGIDGGLVMIGASTREFSRKEFGAWVEWLYAVAVEKGVKIPERETA